MAWIPSVEYVLSRSMYRLVHCSGHPSLGARLIAYKYINLQPLYIYVSLVTTADLICKDWLAHITFISGS